MSDVILTNVARFVGLFLVQVLILINVDINTAYINLYIYPLFLLFLPIKIPNASLLLIAFILGISIDMFYNTAGVNAATCVFTAFLRPTILRILEPKGGYDVMHTPTKHQFGLNWFLQYSGIFFFIHLALLFFLEVFSFASFGTLLLKLLLSYLLSMLLVVIYVYLFNPKK
jgi:hypothetical protein